MHKFVLLATAVVLVSLPAHAAGTPPQVFQCGKPGTVGGLGAGTDLIRHVVDVTRFPEATCNDGTPAVFYYGAATKPADRNKWIIFLQGGGSCNDGQTCAERWCGIDTNYGMDKMSTSLSKPAIRGLGFMNPDPKNQFGGWNRVLIYYCSSDVWRGRSSRTLQAAINSTTAREYQIGFHGSKIIDAVLDTLRNSGPPVRRRPSTQSLEQAETSPWPDLDDAEGVILAGSSAGGGGARANADRVGERLRRTNPDVDFRALFDAIYTPQSDQADYTKTVYCANDPVHGCSYETFTRAANAAIDEGLLDAFDEESCREWHKAHQPGSEWRCGDGSHFNMHHITTPFFMHQDLQDTQIGGGWVEAGFGTPAEYATRVEEEFRHPPVPEEPRGAEPGFFAPQCTDHESFTDDDAVYEVKLAGISYHDAVWNWWRGSGPRVVIRPFSGTPGKAPECP